MELLRECVFNLQKTVVINFLQWFWSNITFGITVDANIMDVRELKVSHTNDPTWCSQVIYANNFLMELRIKDCTSKNCK